MAKLNISPKTNFNVLFTCIGRRVSLLNSFIDAAKDLRLKTGFFGTDTTEFSPALQLCDGYFLVKPTTHSGYIKQILSIVKQKKIKLLVPTVDLDLKILAQNKSKFEKLGCCVLVSSPEVINICQDKRKTYRFLRNNGFDSPETMSIRTALTKNKLSWPCFLKPWDGYASRGNAIVNNRKELSFFSKKIPNPICQEFISGTEYTCDVYVDFDMKVRTVVPRKRIEVRAGEVSKAEIVKDLKVMKKSAQLIEKLGAGPGVITIQLFKTKDKKIKFIEINPRFGGGIPLSIKAGANSPKWILQELTRRKPKTCFDDFEDGLVMLRYDSEVWFKNNPKK